MVDIKQTLTRKIGPLPAWAWIGAILVGVVFLRNRASSGDGVNDPYADDTIGDPNLPIDQSGAMDTGVSLPVQTTTGGGVASGYDTQAYPTDGTQFPASTLPDQTPWWLDPNYAPPDNTSVPVDSTDTQSAPNTTTDNQPAAVTKAQAAKSFQWGGRNWSKGDLPAFKRYLQQHGSTYEGWAHNHPQAATTVFGTKATPPPKTRVSGGGMVATKPKKKKTQTGGGAPAGGAAKHAPLPAPQHSSAAASGHQAQVAAAITRAQPAPAHSAPVAMPQAPHIAPPKPKPAPKPAPKPVKGGRSIAF